MSKVRCLLATSEGVYIGPGAYLTLLKKWQRSYGAILPPKGRGVRAMREILAKVAPSWVLTVIREPRRNRRANSRYIQQCLYHGIGRPLRAGNRRRQTGATPVLARVGRGELARAQQYRAAQVAAVAPEGVRPPTMNRAERDLAEVAAVDIEAVIFGGNPWVPPPQAPATPATWRFDVGYAADPPRVVAPGERVPLRTTQYAPIPHFDEGD